MSKKNHSKGKIIKDNKNIRSTRKKESVKAKKIVNQPEIEDIKIALDALPFVSDAPIETEITPTAKPEPAVSPLDSIQSAALEQAEEILNTYKTLFSDKTSEGSSVVDYMKEGYEKSQHYKDSSERMREDMLRLKEEAENILRILQSDDQGIRALAEELSIMVHAAEDKIKALDKGYSDLFEAEVGKSRWQEIMDSYRRLNDYCNEIYDLRNELVGYDELVFDEQISPEEAKILAAHEFIEKEGSFYRCNMRQHAGLKEKFDDELNRLKQQAEKQRQIFKEEHNQTKRLQDDIKNLLPGAMRAGFSHMYRKAKKEHQKSMENWQKVLYGTLAGFLLIAIIGYGLSAVNMASLEGQGLFLMQVLPFELPVIFLMILSAVKIGQYGRLIEGYRHKETVAVNFESLRKVSADLSAELPETSVQNKLYSHTLNVYSENPIDPLYENHSTKAQQVVPSEAV